MAAFNEIAYVERQHATALTHSRISYSSEFVGAPHAPQGLRIYDDERFGLTATVVYDLTATYTSPNLVLAAIYADRGFVLNAEASYRTVPNFGKRKKKIRWRLTIERGFSATEDLQFTVGTNGGVYVDTNVAIDPWPAWYLDVEDLQFLSQDFVHVAANPRPLQGRAVRVEYDAGTDAWTEFLPPRPVFTPVPFWCRIDDQSADFQALTIDASGEAQSVAERLLTLTARYSPALDDLDTIIRFGVDSNGIPIRWLIQSSNRDGDNIVLSLSASVV